MQVTVDLSHESVWVQSLYALLSEDIRIAPNITPRELLAMCRCLEGNGLNDDDRLVVGFVERMRPVGRKLADVGDPTPQGGE